MSYSSIKVGTYLFQRLSEVTRSVFGVPGDFNLNLLEHIYNFKESEIKWCGNANELNAGYAADGYSRINNFGCLITTYGVGELSALNAIGGSYAENAPVLHIVGTSSTTAKANTCEFNQIHHLIPGKNTYDAPDHYVYEKLADAFSCHTESLSDKNLTIIQDQIDAVIENVICHMKPGYLFIPSNLPDMDIDVDLDKPLNFDPSRLMSIDGEETSKLVSYALKSLYLSSNPAIIVDQFMKFDLEVLNDFLSRTNFYCYNTTASRGFADESLPNFHGIFNNALSTDGTLDILKDNDFVLYLGANINESNYFSSDIMPLEAKHVLFIGKDYGKLGMHGSIIPNINTHVFFNQFISRINYASLPKVNVRSTTASYNNEYIIDKSSDKISQAKLSQFVTQYLKPNDIIVNEMCSFMFEMSNIRYPKHTKSVGQPFYGSIGYAVPATLGVSLAMKDYNKSGRVILFQGDGSAQMTLQEFASYIRFNISPIIFMLNNSGYSVERVIKGPTRSYNDILVDWDWCKIFSVFGDPNSERSVSFKVSTMSDLRETLSIIDENDGKAKMIELALEKMDVPVRFKKLAHVE